MPQIAQNKEKLTQSNWRYCSNVHEPCRCQHIARMVLGLTVLIFLSECAGVRDKTCQHIAAEKNTEQFMKQAKVLRILRCQNRVMFNFHSIWSVIIGKLEIKSRETCKYKIDIDSDGSLIPIRMFKMFFLHTNLIMQNKSVEKTMILCIFNTLCLPQIRVSRVAIINKAIKNQSSSFVVPGNGPVLLGIPGWWKSATAEQ